jgi:hypothetical protein
MASTACLDAPYGAKDGIVVRPASEAVFTMWPSFCSTSAAQRRGSR